MGAAWGFAGVVVGAFITGLVSIGGELVRGQHEVNLDGAKRANDRQIERERFQRDNLVGVQERFAEWMRGQVKLSIEDERSLGGTGALALLPPDLNTEVSDTSRQLGYRVERITDDALRHELVDLMRLATELHLTRIADGSRQRVAMVGADMGRLMSAHGNAQESLGEVLRRYL